MAVGYNPRTVTDGLVLALDAGNQKNYNAGISTNWVDKVGGNNGTLVGGTNHTDGPFVGAGYVEFDGTGDYLSLASSSDWDLGSGDFTIEFWAYFNDVTTAQKTLITRRNALPIYAPYYLGCDTSSRIIFFASSNGSSYDVANNLTFGSLTTNRWYHIALVRNGSQFTGYIDGTGTSLLTSSATLYNNSQSLVVGAETDLNFEHDGFISNLRIIKGTALYTSNFTPPTGPLTAVPNTVLLTCQGNTIADASSSAHTITANGDAAARLGFPASAFEFDGSILTYATTGYNSDLYIGTDVFTIECWFYANSTANATIAVAQSGAQSWATVGWYLQIYDGKVQLSGSSGAGPKTVTGYSTASITANTWHHVAAVKDVAAGKYYLYLDGVQNAGYSIASSGNQLEPFTVSTPPLVSLGAAGAGWNFGAFNGYISNFRIYKGKGLTSAEVTQNYNATKGRYA